MIPRYDGGMGEIQVVWVKYSNGKQSLLVFNLYFSGVVEVVEMLGSELSWGLKGVNSP